MTNINVTNNQPVKGEMVNFLQGTEKNTKILNKELLTLMPKESVESVKGGLIAPLIPSTTKQVSNSEISNIVEELGGMKGILSGIVSIVGFVAKEIEGSNLSGQSIKEDIKAFGGEVVTFFKSGEFNEAATSLMSKAGKVLVNDVNALADKTLTGPEKDLVNGVTKEVASTLTTGSSNSALGGDVLDMASLLILLFALNAKMKRAEQDSAVTTSMLQAKELKSAAKATAKSAMDAFWGVLAGGILSIASNAFSMVAGIKGGQGDAEAMAQIDEQLGPKPQSVLDNVPVSSFKEGDSDPLNIGLETYDESQVTGENIAEELTITNEAFENTKTKVQDGIRAYTGDEGTYVNKDGTLNKAGLEKYNEARSGFENYVREKTEGSASVKQKAVDKLFDKNGMLTERGKEHLQNFVTMDIDEGTISSETKSAIANLIRYSPDQMNKMMAYPRDVNAYLKFTKQGEFLEGEELKTFETNREKEIQKVTDYEKRAQPLMDKIMNTSRARTQKLDALTQLSQVINQMVQSGTQIASKGDESKSQSEQADAGMTGATKQNIDSTVSNIDGMLSALLSLLQQYLSSVNQAQQSASRLV